MNATVLTAQGETPIAPIGHNKPPATPYEALKAHIDDLYDEARNFLDGEPIATEEQAEAVSKLLDDARKAKAAAEEQRKIEAKPFDDGKAEVQGRYNPLCKDKTGKCDLIAETAKKALAPWLEAVEAKQWAAAETARKEAEELAVAARKAAETAAPDDLASLTTVRALQDNAAEAAKLAARLGKATAQAKGGERAVGLRTAYRAEITDALAFAKWAWANRNPDYLEFLTGLAERECRHGPKGIPGVEVHEERKAV